MKEDFYELLGISKDATDEEIKKKYRSLAMKHHPDRNVDNKETAELQFKKIKEAYEVLSDPEKRQLYNLYGHDGLDPNRQQNPFGNGNPFDDMFGSFFNGAFQQHHQHQPKGQDIRFKLDLTLEEAVFGITKEINVPSNVTCTSCDGSGAKRGSVPVTCNTCNGHGQVIMDQGFFKVQQNCPTCHGQGKVIKDHCPKCHGHGVVKEFKSVMVVVPAGINTGESLQITGKGNSGKGGIIPGDLFVDIQIKPHKIFKRDVNNLLCDIFINFELACLGGSIEIPTLNGSVKMVIPAETQTGTKFKLGGKGAKNLKTGQLGDIICTVILETPKNLSDEQKEILKSLKL